MTWKHVRVSRKAWAAAKRAVAGTEIPLDRFVSYILESSDVHAAVTNYQNELAEKLNKN